MKLPILSQVNHLSPSSLAEMENCNMKFYLKRMAGLSWPEGTQSTAAAVGSAFDAFVKADLAKHLGLDGDPKNQLDFLLTQSVEDHNKDIALNMGQVLFKNYRRTGMFDRLIKEGLTSIEMTQRKDICVEENLVPVLGKPDAALSDGTMVDWKVQGAASASGASPTPGYCYGRRGFDTLPPHKRCGEPLEAINDKWASQLAIYSWLYSGILPFRDVPVAIENVTVRGNKYTFTSIRTHISADFQLNLWERLIFAWNKAITGDMDDAIPTKQRCYAYNSRCEVADRCEAFQKWENSQGEGVDVVDKLMGR